MIPQSATDTENDTATETAIATEFDSGSDSGSYWGGLMGTGTYAESQFESDTSSDTTTTTYGLSDSIPSLGATASFNSSDIATYHESDDATYGWTYTESGRVLPGFVATLVGGGNYSSLIDADAESLTGASPIYLSAFESGDDDQTDDGRRPW